MDAEGRRTLNEALGRLADGDRAAFHPVFELAWPVARDFARSVLRSPVEAEDAAQQALVRLFERAAEFDRAREALPWVFGVVWNECRTVRRRALRRREHALDGVGERASRAPGPEEALLESDRDRAVREALMSLNPSDVETILADLGEVPRSGVAAATFRKRLERARRRLRDAWRARHGVV